MPTTGVDLTVENYSIIELLGRLGLTENATKADIKRVTEGFFHKYRNSPNAKVFQNFFTAAQAKLYKYIDEGILESQKHMSFADTTSNMYNPDQQERSKGMDGGITYQSDPGYFFLAEQNKDINRGNYVQITGTGESGTSRPIMTRRKLPVTQQYPVDTVQGQLNPIFRSKHTTTLSIDSQYREWKQEVPDTTRYQFDTIGGVSCEAGIEISPGLVGSSTDFTLNIVPPLSNVISLRLAAIEIPKTWYEFSSDYGTNMFKIAVPEDRITGDLADVSNNGAGFIKNEETGKWEIEIKIISPTLNPDASNPDGTANPDDNQGDFTGTDIIANLAASLEEIHKAWKIKMNSRTKYVTIYDSSYNAIDLIFYDDSWSKGICGDKGAKLDFNLGTMLGYTKSKYTGGYGYRGGSGLKEKSVSYLFLSIDDFANNRISSSIAAQENVLPKFTTPDYAKEIKCGENDRLANHNALTEKQKFTANEMEAAKETSSQNRFFSPTPPDTLARISIPGGAIEKIQLAGLQLQINRRDYFGPVTIKRMRVRLFDNKGRLLNLNNDNFSFQLLVEHLYQF